jgi:hypothetical protein
MRSWTGAGGALTLFSLDSASADEQILCTRGKVANSFLTQWRRHVFSSRHLI